MQTTGDNTDLIRRLERLGERHRGWGKSADSYFSHTSGKVGLGNARDFYNEAVKLAEEAAQALRQGAETPRL